MEPIVARKTRRTTEVYHGLVYFVPEATERYEALGMKGFGGYFGSRAAAMGAVSCATVVATFFNFRPQLVAQAIPTCWEVAPPQRWWDARVEAVDAALRRILGDDHPGAPETKRAADLAVSAAETARTEGRPLAAAHLAEAVPDDPHLALWWAITVLREHRGDGHIAALVDAGLSGCEALVLHAATAEVPEAGLRGTRAWTEEEWAATVEGLVGRGLVDADGSFTEEGRALREGIEDMTDRLAVQPYEAIGEDGCAELRSLVRPWSKAVVEGDAFGFARQNEMFEANGRVALVTGAGQGVGVGIARALAAQGATVAVNDLVPERGEATVADIGGRAIAAPFDVTDRAAVDAVVARISDEVGPVDILVNNAGVPVGMDLVKFRDAPPEHWRLYIDLNMYGSMHCIQSVLGGMCDRGWGRIVQISSGAGRAGLNLGISMYGASKSGIEGLVRHVSQEVARNGVTANCLALGMMGHAGSDVDDTATAPLVRTIPVGRLGTPDDVGAAVVFLASDEASWLTGQTIDLNGGSVQH